MYHILFYKTIEDYIERRAQFREEHLALVRKAHTDGNLFMAGALSDPPDGAVLIFTNNDPLIAEEFAHNDPYVKNGLITHWEVRPWIVVVE
jgi:uncharacterized protein